MTALLKRFGQNSSSDSVSAGVLSAVALARCVVQPYRYWLFSDIISQETCRDIVRLPVAPAPVGDTYGKRDTHNDSRRFFSPLMQIEFPVMRAVAEAFQGEPVVRALETLFGVSFRGSYLRIEYCQDRNGFWLEPHMDIKEKRITLQVYLNEGLDAAALGTDIYDKDKKPVCSAPSTMGQGMAFIPQEPDSWHGFEKRPIADVRRSLIINYVNDDWRSRHELAFPDRKIA